MECEMDQRHKTRMQRKKEVIDASIARASLDKGLIVVLTGNGKGKSSSAFGMLTRALGHKMKSAVVQFIKGGIPSGEELFFRRFPEEVSFNVCGEGFTWETQDKERDIKKARDAWDKARSFLADPEIEFIVLDELNIVLKLKYLDIDLVIEDLQSRPPMQHVVITGRGAPEKLIAIADTVSEIQELKHAYKAGIRAQKGIEL